MADLPGKSLKEAVRELRALLDRHLSANERIYALDKRVERLTQEKNGEIREFYITRGEILALLKEWDHGSDERRLGFFYELHRQLSQTEKRDETIAHHPQC